MDGIAKFISVVDGVSSSMSVWYSWKAILDLLLCWIFLLLSLTKPFIRNIIASVLLETMNIDLLTWKSLAV